MGKIGSLIPWFKPVFGFGTSPTKKFNRTAPAPGFAESLPLPSSRVSSTSFFMTGVASFSSHWTLFFNSFLVAERKAAEGAVPGPEAVDETDFQSWLCIPTFKWKTRKKSSSTASRKTIGAELPRKIFFEVRHEILWKRNKSKASNSPGKKAEFGKLGGTPDREVGSFRSFNRGWRVRMPRSYSIQPIVWQGMTFLFYPITMPKAGSTNQ